MMPIVTIAFDALSRDRVRLHSIIGGMSGHLQDHCHD